MLPTFSFQKSCRQLWPNLEKYLWKCCVVVNEYLSLFNCRQYIHVIDIYMKRKLWLSFVASITIQKVFYYYKESLPNPKNVTLIIIRVMKTSSYLHPLFRDINALQLWNFKTKILPDKLLMDFICDERWRRSNKDI